MAQRGYFTSYSFLTLKEFKRLSGTESDWAYKQAVARLEQADKNPRRYPLTESEKAILLSIIKYKENLVKQMSNLSESLKRANIEDKERQATKAAAKAEAEAKRAAAAVKDAEEAAAKAERAAAAEQKYLNEISKLSPEERMEEYRRRHMGGARRRKTKRTRRTLRNKSRRRA
jgi:membrane protein involved in colicin uptake